MHARAAMSSAPWTRVGNGNSKENISQTNIATRTSMNRSRCLLYSVYKGGKIVFKCGYSLVQAHYKPGFILILRVEIILPSHPLISNFVTERPAVSHKHSESVTTDRDQQIKHLSRPHSKNIFLPLEKDKINYLYIAQIWPLVVFIMSFQSPSSHLYDAKVNRFKLLFPVKAI